MKLEIVEALRLMRDTGCTAYHAARVKKISLPYLYLILKKIGLPAKQADWPSNVRIP